MKTTKITQLRNETTGETAPVHRIGTDEEGRAIVQRVEGWQPVDASGQPVECECDCDGNWLV